MPQREAISFGRFSAKGKQEQGDSVRRQQAAYERVCERYKDRCAPSTRYGFGSFFGRGESGFHARHLRKGGSLKVLLDKLQSGEIDPHKACIVVEAFDRLARVEPDLAMQLLSDIVRSGCPVVVDSPDLWIEPADLGGHKFLLIAAMLQLAHAESKQKSDRLTASWQARRASLGQRPATSVCPRWCRARAGKFVLVPDLAAVVRRIYELCVGGMGAQAIARVLNDEGVPVLKPTKRNRGMWDLHAVNFILRTRTAIGEYQPRQFARVGGKRKLVDAGDPVRDYYPAAVDAELFYRAQGACDQRKVQTGRPPAPHNGVNLFRGILFDADTRSSMTARTGRVAGRTYKYLVPSVAIKDGKGWASVPYALVEAAFLTFVKELTLDSAEANTVRARLQAEETLAAEVRARIDRLNAEEDLDVLLPLIRKLAANLKAAELRVEALRREQSQKPGDDVRHLQTLAHQWDEAEKAGLEAFNSFKEVLRNKIGAVVSEMWAVSFRKNRSAQTILLQVFLRAGGCRWLAIKTTGRRGAYLGSAVAAFIDPATDLRGWKR